MILAASPKTPMMVLYSYLVGSRRFRPAGGVLRLEELVHDQGGGVGQVEDRILLAGGDGDQDVAEVELVLQKSDVLASEQHRDLLGVSAAVLRELADRHGDAGVVPVPLGGHPAGPDHEEASLEGLL